jgi:Helicase C-terminal domain
MDLAAILSDLNSARFKELRPAQAVAAAQYQRQSDLADVAIELPTGAGKSLLALLICHERLLRGGTAAILTGNKQLARQMEREAVDLGVEVVRMEGSGTEIPVSHRRAYNRGSAIGVMNYWVYFNQNPVVDPAELLVLDDAHLAEGAFDSLYSCVVDRFKHSQLHSRLASDLSARLPDYPTLADASLGLTGTSGAELISFLDQAPLVSQIREIIDGSEEIRTDTDLGFRWSRLRPRLEQCNLYVSGRSICFRPQIYPLRRNRHYEEADQRVYMSATIGNPADLARRLGSDPITKFDTGDAHAAETYGRRMLVMASGGEDGQERHWELLESALEAHPKCLWLCVSSLHANQAETDLLARLASRWIAPGYVAQLSSDGDELTAFKQAERGHLFVAGRFDGMDFSGDECRLVAILRMPTAINLQEEFFNAYLRDANFMLQRLNQRILQAVGRCNRSSDDYAVYLLGDQRFVVHFGKDSHRRGMPAAIRAELDMAEDGTELPLQDLGDRVKTFLAGRFDGFDAELANVAEGIPFELEADGNVADDSKVEVQGWLDLYQHESYEEAAESFRKASKEAAGRDEKEVGAYLRYLEAKALFLEGQRGSSACAGQAETVLGESIDWGGEKSAWFNRLKGSLNRYRSADGATVYVDPGDYRAAAVARFDEMLEKLGSRGPRFERYRERLKRLLASSSHAEYQEGLELLGEALGYYANRPRYTAATDCRWRGAFGNQREAVAWEAKIEQVEGRRVSPSDVGQAHNQRNRAEAELSVGGYAVRSAIVTAMDSLETAAEASRGSTVVVERKAIDALLDRVLTLLGMYRDVWTEAEPSTRIAAAGAVQHLLPPTGWLGRALEGPGPFVGAELLLAEWPSPSP